MVKTTLPGCDDGAFRQAFKTLLPYEKEEKMKVMFKFLCFMVISFSRDSVT